MENTLKQTISELFQVDPNQIGHDFSLTGGRMQGSLGRARLDAAIRHRLGVKCQKVYSAKTYGELASAVLGVPQVDADSAEPLTAIPPSENGERDPALTQSAMASTSLLACGIDLEMVDNLPEAKDYWEDPFYSTSFSSVEIAYCLLQENPRMHFAARWCAKEALKKCEPSLMQEEMKNLELVSGEENSLVLRHYVNGVPEILQVAVSISHTSHMAVAMVIKK